MKKFGLVVILFLLGLLIACKPKLNVNTDYDDSVDFTKFKTYQWHSRNKHNQLSRDYLGNDIMDQRIRKAINQQLMAKGFQEKMNGDPVDFWVNYSILVENKTDIRSYNTYNGYAPGFRYGMGYGSYGRRAAVGYSTGSETRVIDYKQGTLIIDILDPKTDKLIWRATGDGRLPKEQTKEEREKMIKQVVEVLMQDFPPQ